MHKSLRADQEKQLEKDIKKTFITKTCLNSVHVAQSVVGTFKALAHILCEFLVHL